jgi:hypothetical protein
MVRGASVLSAGVRLLQSWCGVAARLSASQPARRPSSSIARPRGGTDSPLRDAITRSSFNVQIPELQVRIEQITPHSHP